ncbi:hypothetical protein [Streptomyces sp. NPDC051286]|uniref:hypothetical protein n=1 Tax=Streptomyces sp. NPDC051286 TaxID=3365647 RepID=UPI0037A8179A
MEEPVVESEPGRLPTKVSIAEKGNAPGRANAPFFTTVFRMAALVRRPVKFEPRKETTYFHQSTPQRGKRWPDAMATTVRGRTRNSSPP